MKRNSKTFKILISAILAAIMVALCTVFSLAATDAAFEKTIAGFPESYKPQLRQLHAAHPKWKFVPLQTGLDWTASVNAEQSGDRSLVTDHSAYTDIFKSKDTGDYDPKTGKFIHKDSGFVTANKLAVSYYMDPRNFLDEKGIFQFEDLTFNSSCTTKSVESVLAGTFMANKNISYYDTKGKLVNTTTKYSTAIYNAGKAHDVNPIFLAGRIKKEIGAAKPGTATSGQDSIYPGIFNFYNIGANDGTIYICPKCGSTSKSSGKCSKDNTERIKHEPAQRGLRWASDGSTYSRPWNTPQKSIDGGAQFIAESYISKGQYTGYLQKFNVNPKSTHKVYDHQYMSDLSAAATPGYSSYQSYKSNGWLDLEFVFSIPVYKNMPAEKNTSGTIQAADAMNQTATSKGTYNVRQSATTESSALNVQLAKGTTANIIDYKFTTATTPDNIMRYPFWTQIKFTQNSKTNTGYVYSNFLNLTTTTQVSIGKYTPVSFKTNNALEYRYISSDPSIAKVVNDTSIEFLKTGNVLITAYDSLGHYDVISYNVNSNAKQLAVSGVKMVKIADTTATVSFNKNSNCTSYEVYVTDTNNKVISSVVTQSNTVEIKSLTAEKNYKVYVRGLKQSGNTKTYSAYTSPVSFKTVSPIPPQKVSGIKVAAKGYDAVSITWNKMTDITGYVVYTYNYQTKAYTKLAVVSASANSYTDKSKNAITELGYSVRAYKTFDGKNIYSDYASAVKFTPAKINVAQVTGLNQTDSSSTSVTVKWNAVKNATGYQILKYDESSKKYVAVATTSATSYTVKSLSFSKAYKLQVRAYIKVYTKTVYGAYSAVLSAITGPDTVKTITQPSTSTTSYKLSWSAVKGATGYRVYKYDSKTKSYKRLQDVTGTSITVSKLSAGKTDKYKIKAYTVKSKVAYYSTSSPEFTVATLPAKVTGVNQSTPNASSYTLTWKAVSGATGYAVYKYDSKTKSYKHLINVSSTSYKLQKLSAAKTDSYKVRAYIKTSTGVRWGAYSDVFSAITAPDTVKAITQASTTTTSYKLSWKAVKGAKGYKIYKYDSKTKAYKCTNTISGTSLTVSKLSAGKTDKYKIKAYLVKSGKTYLSVSSPVFTVATLPAKTTGVKQSATTASSYTLSWKAVSGATGYAVYKYDSKTKAYKHVINVSTTSYKVSKLSAAKADKYKVRAYIKTSTGVRWGGFSDILSATTAPATVTSIKQSSTTKNSYTLSWAAVKGASGYRIYKYDAKTKTYVKLADISKTSYKITGLAAGKTMQYKVRAYTKTATGTYWGTASSAFSAKTAS